MPLGLPSPDLLRDAALAAERRVREAVGQDRVRLAVTGLTRAGKTVFLTALIANLLAAGQGRHTLRAFEQAAGGRLRGARLKPAGIETVPRFDVHAHLAALAADPPAWPGRTEDLATLELTLDVSRRFNPLGSLPPRGITLELLDYPGEWLLDLPMLTQDYSVWSAATLARLRAPARRPATGAFLAFVDALPAQAPEDEAVARRGFALYRDALRACRDTLGFRFLQPGRTLNPGPRGEAPILWFFPLPHPAGGGLAASLARRHAAYIADQRETFFEPFFRRFQRQAVLVDVLGALHAGEAAFADTAEALAAIGSALHRGGGWLERVLGLGVERVAFVATKADHVPGPQRPALAALLGQLLHGGAFNGLAASATGVYGIAALRCTEDDTATLDGRTVSAVRGILLKEGRRAKVWPGEVPATPPGPAFWAQPAFEMPAFRPPRLDPAGQSGVPHLGLDELLAYLIGDLL